MAHLTQKKDFIGEKEDVQWPLFSKVGHFEGIVFEKKVGNRLLRLPNRVKNDH